MGIIVNVSHWDELVDWPAAQAAGVTDVVIKLTHGRHGGDPYALRNWNNAGKLGIRRGIFMWPVPAEEEPQLQVRNFWQFAQALGYDPAVGWFAAGDIEEKYKLTPDFAYAIESEIEQQLQVKAWAYANPDILLHYLDKRMQQFELWDADWNPIPMQLPGFKIGLLQYTRYGHVAGFAGHVDLNRFPDQVVIPDPLYQVTVNLPADGGLNVRSGPGIQWPAIDALRGGNVVSVFEELKGWLAIDGQLGKWISGAYAMRVPA